MTSNIQLYQGDCLEVMKNIPDKSIDLVLTDPPYGTTACKWDSVIPLEPMWKELKRIAKDNAAIVLFGSQPFTTKLISSNVKDFRYCWTWVKSHGSGFMNAKKMPIKNTEDVIVFYRKLPTYNPQGLKLFGKKIKTRSKFTEDSVYGKIGLDALAGKEFIQEFTNYPTQLLEFKSEKGIHPTQKPVALMEYLIKTYSNEGMTVLDFCAGSGTTGVAAKNLNRNFIGIEMDEGYFKIASSRIADAESAKERIEKA